LLLGLTRRAALRISVRELPLLAFYGIVGIVAVQLLYAIALDRLTVSLALLLEYTAPVLVALWARVVLREHVRTRVWAALVLALGGLCLVAQVWLGLHLDLVGTLAGLGASVSLAIFWLVVEHAVNDTSSEHAVAPRDPLSLTCWGMTIGALAWFVIRAGSLPTIRGFDEAVSLSGRMDGVRLPVAALVAWVCIAGTLIPFVLDVAALRHVSATTVGLVGMLEPVGATIVAWLWLEQRLTAAQAIGVAVVIVGIVLAQTARSGTERPPAAGLPEVPDVSA
jgi:drug/metabolite transporter (DMT)-like permease